MISIHPVHTNIEGPSRSSDEFPLEFGNFYVVCRMYADLWALCAKVSLFEGDREGEEEHCLRNIAFLPICSVTLAANFGAFITRCSHREKNSAHNEPMYPGNGLSVTPPERSHSLTASKQVFHEISLQGIGLPAVADEACKTVSLEGMDFVPLDSTLEHLISEMGESRMLVLFRKVWRRFWHSNAKSSVADYGTQGRAIFRRGDRGVRTSLLSAGRGLKQLVSIS